MKSQNQDNICTWEQPTCKSVPKRSPILGALALILAIFSLHLGPIIIYLFFLLLFSSYPFLFDTDFMFIGYPLSILGLIFSILSIVRKERLPGLAIAGIVCSVCGFLEVLIYQYFYETLEFFADFDILWDILG